MNPCILCVWRELPYMHVTTIERFLELIVRSKMSFFVQKQQPGQVKSPGCSNEHSCVAFDDQISSHFACVNTLLLQQQQQHNGTTSITTVVWL